MFGCEDYYPEKDFDDVVSLTGKGGKKKQNGDAGLLNNFTVEKLAKDIHGMKTQLAKMRMKIKALEARVMKGNK